MNKQAITFLSLFSLILVLSIYYIMLPSQDTQTSTNNDLNTIEELQTALDQKRDQIIAENNDIIAKESSTSESISKALETISETKELKDKEKEILTLIQNAGYQDVYVEIDGKLVQVTIIKKDATNSDANNVIKTVLQSLGDEYQVEVKFVNE
ncbi:MAG: SpoIIIAH-like family protein [Bacilli bacterium]|nr:SpoIIIAH-like family protein [Bacilli bacterium]